jgi:diguanylate cyclase (GGDEF)-like protein/PAS domain S-box-containing protein
VENRAMKSLVPDLQVRQRVAPFAACAVVGWALLLLPPYAPQLVGHLLVAGALTVLIALMALWVADHRLWWVQGAPPLLFFVVIAVLRDADGGGLSGMSPLTALPVLWIALYGTRVQMWLAGAAVAVVFLSPLLFVHSGAYPLSDWRRAVLWTLISTVIGTVVQTLVRQLADQERQASIVRAHLDAVLRAATGHSIIATNLDGVITTFSEGAEQMLGYRASELVYRHTPSLLHDRLEVMARAEELGIEPGFDVFVHEARQGRSATREWTYIRADGNEVPVRLHVTAITDPAGAQIGFLGIATDISAERRALAEVRGGEQRWRILLDHLPDTSVLVAGPDLRFRVAAGAGLRSQGMADVEGKSLYETSSPTNVALLEPILNRALAGEEGSVELFASNTGRINEVTVSPLPLHNGEAEALLVARDVTEARSREAGLRIAQQRFEQLFYEAPNGAMTLSLDGHILQINPAQCAMLGRAEKTLVGLRADALGGSSTLLDGFLRALNESPTGRFAAETRMLHADGHLVDVTFDSSLLCGADGVPEAVLINSVDISERRRYEAQLLHLADHDPLTGLANRRRFDSELAAHLDRCQRYGPRGALMMLDLDNFKQVNDTLGHGAGDQLIIGTADLLRGRLRASDLVARLGGDEFAILLPEADRDAANRVAADIVAIIREHASVLDGSRPRRVTTSIGVVMIDRPDLSPSELMSTVDLTMYDAKEAGRDRYAILDTTTYAGPRSGAHLAWADRINDALAEDRFELHAQPILDLTTNTITGAELLLRMIGEKGETILPGRFLYIAERLGLMTRIDTWVADQAIELLETIHAYDPKFHLEVNLSGHSVGNPNLAAYICSRVQTSDINPRYLTFEITETAAVANIETARAFAETIANLGCRFALDDFGAGFGSFYYLKHLPFDYVKIDGEFVSKCTTNFTDRLILSSIVDIAHGLGKRTIAEFVADADTLKVVADHGVDFAQGYHIGRPLPIQELLSNLVTASPTSAWRKGSLA